jgi:uncharacterized membrane protein YjgN (DUF898 family)
MNELASVDAAGELPSIQFTGTMREFLPIAVSNLLLTIVTLFVYRSWAKARERRYLWSRTRFIDDTLEWTGTGKEMFIGFIVVALLLGVIWLIFSFGLPAIAARFGPVAGIGTLLAFYIGGMFLYGLARFRALRYRLSRTWWRGIRGGSNDGGVTYGRKAIGYYLASFLVFGFLYPWAQAKLWNERWNKMSFGPIDFEAQLTSDDTKGPFFAFLAALIIGNVVIGLFTNPNIVVFGPGLPRLVVPLLAYCAIGATYLNYLAAYYRAAVEWTRIGDLEFRLNAEFTDWLKFFLATVGLAIVTLGLAMAVYEFRKWRFITSHLEAFGAVDVDQLTQSQTRAPREAEGFLDALDIGAF